MFYLFAYLSKGECTHAPPVEQAFFFKQLYSFLYQMSLRRENMFRVRLQKDGQKVSRPLTLHGPFFLFSSPHAFSWYWAYSALFKNIFKVVCSCFCVFLYSLHLSMSYVRTSYMCDCFHCCIFQVPGSTDNGDAH